MRVEEGKRIGTRGAPITEFQKRFPFFALTDNAAENHSKMKTFSN